jgi:phage terminase Nu1 subunit (DNA packaging protein)
MIVAVGRLAGELGVGERRVQQLVEIGMPRTGRGRYNLVDCFRWFVRRQADLLETRKSVPGSGLLAEQERLTKVKADREELELARSRGELIPLAVYEEQMAELIMSARMRLLALPARLAPDLEGQERAGIRVRLKREIHSALTSLASGPGATSGAAGPAPKKPARKKSSGKKARAGRKGKAAKAPRKGKAVKS